MYENVEEIKKEYLGKLEEKRKIFKENFNPYISDISICKEILSGGCSRDLLGQVLEAESPGKKTEENYCDKIITSASRAIKLKLSQNEAAFFPKKKYHKTPIDLILECIHFSQKSIYIASHSMPLNSDIINALCEANVKRHLQIGILIGSDINLEKKYQIDIYNKLHESEIPLYQYQCDGTNDGDFYSFNNKFMIFDEKELLTGSYNYGGWNNQYNIENVILLRNTPDILTQYMQEWARLRDESTKCKNLELPVKELPVEINITNLKTNNTTSNLLVITLIISLVAIFLAIFW
jgi:phosphatidylserine/phosphatidylglycerophosphate/cardiolipin synthase-like enzyme